MREKNLFDFFDCPGSLNFLADTKSALHAADGVLVVIGASGIRMEIERVWEYIKEQELPCVIFVNELDKERTDFEATLGEIEKTLESRCVPVTLPLGRRET